MKTILVIYRDWREVADTTEYPAKEDVINMCFIVRKYDTESHALMAYANTRCTWSTLLNDDDDPMDFIELAYEKIVNNDYEWLEEHFV